MNYFELLKLEMKKIRRSKILLIVFIPVIMIWIPGLVNSDMIFDIRDIPITPEDNFFIQGFMGMTWFMIPASLVICTVLLTQTERSGRGMLKMLSLPVSMEKLCLAKFTILILLSLFQMILSVTAYYIFGMIASKNCDYNLLLSLAHVAGAVLRIYAGAVPMAAVFWMLAVLIPSPVFSVGAGLASIVPSVLVINTKIWFLYPMSYSFYLLMVEYGKAAEGVYESQPELFPWLPAAGLITFMALLTACIRYGAHERR